MKSLSDIEGLGEPDKAAIDRLYEGRGTAQDLRLATLLFEGLGEHALAEHLRGMSR